MEWSVLGRVPIAYDPYLPGRSVERVTGVAHTRAGEAPWAAIVKITAAPAADTDPEIAARMRTARTAARRELDAYRSGLLVTSAAPFRGPRLLAASASAEPGVPIELWLEDIVDEMPGHWPPERFVIAARHLGAFNGSHPVTDFQAMPSLHWDWRSHHAQPAFVARALDELAELATGADGRLIQALGPRFIARTRRLIETAPQTIAALEARPVILCHHDAVRSNLLTCHTPAGDVQTVAIDWEYAGAGPPGADLAPLVIGSVRRGEADARDLSMMEAAAMRAFVSALHDAGDATPAAFVERAYAGAVALRWHVVLGAARAVAGASTVKRHRAADETPSEALDQAVLLARHILDTAEPLLSPL